MDYIKRVDDKLGQVFINVVLLDLRGAEVTTAHQDDAIRQLERLQHFLRILDDEFVVLLAALHVVDVDDDLFDLLELVHAIQPSSVLAVRAGFAPKAVTPTHE